jgi:hypothetical protein
MLLYVVEEFNLVSLQILLNIMRYLYPMTRLYKPQTLVLRFIFVSITHFHREIKWQIIFPLSNIPGEEKNLHSNDRKMINPMGFMLMERVWGN